MSTISVLTGDIAGSTQLEPVQLDAALDAVQAAFADLRAALGAASIARHRGDGWQIAISAPRMQARLALMIRARLRRLDGALSTRIAMAEAEGTITPGADLNAAHGPAFIASGRLLDRTEGPRIAVAGGGALAAALRLMDHLSEGWTQAQARAMVPMLRPDAPSLTAAAAELGITRQTLSQALQGAGYAALSEALEMLESPP